MGYSKAVLERIAQSIWDDEQRDVALKVVGKIKFFSEEGKEMCTAGQAREAFRGTTVEFLIDDLRRNFTRFLTPDDLRA